MKQQSIQYGQTKQHNPQTNARFCNKINANKQEQNNKTEGKQTNTQTPATINCITRLLYFETPYFRTFPEDSKPV